MLESLYFCLSFHLSLDNRLGGGRSVFSGPVSSFQGHKISSDLWLPGPLVKGRVIGKCCQLHCGLFCFPQGLHLAQDEDKELDHIEKCYNTM